ncbi:CU044_5270 family protein [Streptomyces griseus]|uniref:CU044_5270 family protein n=1 Tax=Streptomyces griseus TaxID=1911 RepID=UPI000568D909|nr:CU044_5270 family protein [Streptomyces griseus]
MSEHEVLGFPGADRLVAAGEVAPPDTAVVAAALAAVRLAAASDGAGVSAGVGVDPGAGVGVGARVGADRASPRTRLLSWRPFGRTRRSRVLLSVAVAAVVAGAVAVPAVPFGDTPPAASAGAASFLHEVAGTAADAKATDAPYWKVRQKMTSGADDSPRPWGRPVPVRKGGGKDGSDVGTIWLCREGMISRAWNGQYALTPAGKGPDAQMGWQVAGMMIDWDDLRELPTEPRALKAYLYSGNPDTPEQEAVFNGIITLLRSPVSPELRSALYDVLAGLPYLRLVGPVRDSAGRAGVAIEYDGEDLRSRLVVDPKTALPLEERNTTLGGPGDGDLVSAVTYLTLQAVRDAPEAVPDDTIPPDPNDPLRDLTSGKK